jgi:DnaJ-domain-containing protein 1
MALYALGLIVLLVELARESPALGVSLLILAGTVGDIHVSRKGESNLGARPSVLRRTLCRLGAQAVVLALVLLDIGGLGLALVSPVLFAPWVIINLAVLVFGTLSWSEEMRVQSEGATAAHRQAEQLRAEQRNAEERLREAQRQEQAERLRQAELREAELRRCQEEEERKAQRQEQAERLRYAELREAELRRSQEEAELEAQRQEFAERLRQAERKKREAERRRRTAEREAQRARRESHTRVATQFRTDWWTVLGVGPSASKDDIKRNYRRKIKECHPDRVVGLAPEFLEVAEEHTKALNEAYANAMRCHAA